MVLTFGLSQQFPSGVGLHALERYVCHARLAICSGVVKSELLCKLSGKNDHSYSKYGPMIALLFLSPCKMESCTVFHGVENFES